MISLPDGNLVRRDGRPCRPVRFSGRWLAPADLDAVIALHHAVREAIPSSLLAHETDLFFAEHIERRGRIAGLFAEDRLVAYGVLGLPGPQDPSFADDLGLPPAAKRRVAAIDGVSVAPEWRGNGLHRLLIACRLRCAVACGRAIALSTVAPGNLPSLRNLLAAGLTIRALLPKFGGQRYVVRRDLDHPLPEGPEEGHWIAVDNYDGQLAALAEGEFGWELSYDLENSKIWYAAPRAG